MRTRYRAGIQYVGTKFGGIAMNTNTKLPTVLGKLEESLVKFCGDKVAFEHLKGSSRTDSGVHALRNVVQFDLVRSPQGPVISTNPYDQVFDDHHHNSADGVVHFGGMQSSIYEPLYSPEAVRKGLNYRLRSCSSFLSITDCSVVSPQFDVRHDAIGRTYMYRIVLPNRSFQRSARFPPTASQAMFYHDRAWVLPYSLNVEAMQAACQHFVGEKDFSSLHTNKKEGEASVRDLQYLAVQRISGHHMNGSTLFIPPWEASSASSVSSPPVTTHMMSTEETTCPDEEIRVFVRADSFVMRMVRNIVGILVAVGKGKLAPSDIEGILARRSRGAIFIDPAPAHGLYLLNVHYADDH